MSVPSETQTCVQDVGHFGNKKRRFSPHTTLGHETDATDARISIMQRHEMYFTRQCKTLAQILKITPGISCKNLLISNEIFELTKKFQIN